MSKVLIATEKPFAAPAVAGIKQILTEAGFEVVLLEKYTTKAELLAAVADVEAIIIRSDIIDAEVFDAAKQLKIVVRAGAGYTSGTELKDKKLGLLAYGNTGRNVARIAKGFGMDIYAYDPFTPAEVIEKEGVHAVASQKELFSTCDIVSLHIPATPETKGSIGRELVSLMPKKGILVNTARKEVINEPELIALLKEREDLRYFADIRPGAHEEFEAAAGDRYFSTPKKMGAQTSEANTNAGLAAARQIVGFIKEGNERFRLNK